MRRLFLLILLLAVPVFAALPPQSSEDLARQANVIVKAEVTVVSSRIQLVSSGYDRIYTLTLRILAVEKGSIGGKKEMKVVCRQTGERLTGWAGPQGQNDVPEKSDIGLFYLRKPASGALRLLEPNGWKPSTVFKQSTGSPSK